MIERLQHLQLTKEEEDIAISVTSRTDLIEECELSLFWLTACRSALEPTCAKKHLEVSLEVMVRSKNSWRWEEYFVVQVQFKIPNGMGWEEWPLKFRQQPSTSVQMEKRFVSLKLDLHPLNLLDTDLGSPVWKYDGGGWKGHGEQVRKLYRNRQAFLAIRIGKIYAGTCRPTNWQTLA